MSLDQSANGQPNFAGPAVKTAPWIASALAVLAVAFQVQVNLSPIGHDIRLGLSDILLPPFLIAAFIHLYSRQNFALILRWRLPWKWLFAWAVATSAWLTFALLIGHAFTGQWQSWALINKYAGWYVLLGYLFLGHWATNIGPDVTKSFLRCFVVASWTICLLTYLAVLISGVARFPLQYLIGADFRPVGLLVNPNAFGFLICLAAVIHLAIARRGTELSHWLGTAGLAVGLAVLVLTGSRSAWLGMVFGLIGLALARRMPWRLMATAAFAAALLVFSAIFLVEVIRELVAGPVTELLSWLSPEYFGSANGQQLVDPESKWFVYLTTKNLFSTQHHTIVSRWDQVLRAWEVWLQHPVSGVGLGGYLWSEAQLGTKLPQQIHNTVLWLLAETGLPGAILVVGFFAISLWSLRPWAPVNRGDPLAIIGFSMLLAFAGFSLGQEAMYQRQLWFLLGTALALSPGRNRQPIQT